VSLPGSWLSGSERDGRARHFDPMAYDDASIGCCDPPDGTVV
jgi:hypothetical protein